ncbi:MAG: SpoIIIAH-like family protein [Clostridia bacterium]|nr:SpoIIIAH-like family protein [Clostridia bacterium]
MKKGKVLGKGQIAVAVMLVALGAAIWLNTKYLPSSTKYLGEASYVSTTEDEAESVQTSAKPENNTEDYFETAKKERTKARETAVETVEEMLDTDKLSDADKKAVLEKIAKIGANIEKESNIETLLKAKGFKKALAVIGDGSIDIIVYSQGLTSAETLQIQDIVTKQTDIPLANIKIIPVTK